MAKKKESNVSSEDFDDIFNLIGGSISQDEDKKVFEAIKALPCSDDEKIRALVAKVRDLEREIHYSRR